MNKKTAIKIIFIFSIIGVLFAGYLTFTKYLLGICPLKEPCPYFLGQPACVYGLAMYIALLVISALLLFKKKNSERPLILSLFWISLVGIIFAVYSTIKEVFLSTCPGGCTYSLLLPTCIYGLIMYIVIFLFAMVLMKKE